VALDEVISGVVERLREPAAVEGRMIHFSRSGVRARADPGQREHAIENLVANALVHGRGTITVRAERPREGWVAVHVLDEGPGLEAEFAARAFDRFERGSDAQDRPGSGLGLSIVRAVASARGGRAGTG